MVTSCVKLRKQLFLSNAFESRLDTQKAPSHPLLLIWDMAGCFGQQQSNAFSPGSLPCQLLVLAWLYLADEFGDEIASFCAGST